MRASRALQVWVPLYRLGRVRCPLFIDSTALPVVEGASHPVEEVPPPHPVHDVAESVSAGLRGKKKRRTLFHLFKRDKYDIICLQETHMINKDLYRLQKE